MWKMSTEKCHECKKVFELSINWTIDNVTFKDNLEVFMCNDCMKKHRN